MLNYKTLENYFLCKGKEFKSFWSEYLKKEERKVLYVLGLGFDPRTLSCFEIIFQNKGESSIGCLVIEYKNDFEIKEPMSSLLKSNNSDLEKLVPKKDWNLKTVEIKSSVDYSMSVDIVTKLKKEDFDAYTDIVIDISAMPNGIYFPLIKTILDWIQSKEIKSDEKMINLHIVVAENAEFDARMSTKRMNDKVTLMYKFRRNLESEAKKKLEKVWIPVLGEDQIDSLYKLNEAIAPKDSCPVFPIPSIDPDRAKNLLVEYREMLVDTLDIETGNFIYSNEQNPFETFRQIYDTAKHYYEIFNELDGCNIVITPMSSKLLCFGSFLAAYVLFSEKKDVGIVHIENQTYYIDSSIKIDEIKKKSTPFTIWLTGEIYDD